MSKPAHLHKLLPEQALAADPADHAWVAASAGTGKTQLLSARVLRLLLAGVPAPAILCITFTKLAAAEMQARVLERLAIWARADDAALAADLRALGEADDDAGRLRARRLFAQLLDSPQGIAVQTIHALAQSLIASFPIEAGVAPGFQTLDDRAGAALRRDLLLAAINRASQRHDRPFLDAIARLSLDGGEPRIMALLGQLGRHAEVLASLGDGPAAPLLRRALGLNTDATAEQDLAAALAGFDAAGVRRLVAAWADAGNSTSLDCVDRASPWLANPQDWESLSSTFLTKSGAPRSNKAVPVAAEKAEPGLKALFDELAAAAADIAARQLLFAAVDRAAAWLHVARVLARDWLQAKAREGVIDYDDMIQAARRLLASPGAADWVRYKLDSRIDHLLVDEAQDTNLAQWEIIEKLSEEFFAGESAREIERRLFVVGDYKQSIFGFQGADPKVYRDRRDHFTDIAADADRPFVTTPLTRNFRSVPAILTLVDAVADALGGTDHPLDPDGVPAHDPQRDGQAGAVLLLPPTEVEDDETADDGEEDAEQPDGERAEGERPGRAEIDHARKLAGMIARWLSPHAPLRLPHNGKPVQPQDILVLVRRRTPFSAALVAALHASGVPVAGVDRLKLADPLAVSDLLALIRFVLQPDDDLTLASLLVSPLLGLGHDQLHHLAFGRKRSLWAELRASEAPAMVKARLWLEEVLGFADFAAPYEFLERVLSGQLDGRARLLGRLGEDARDPIDTLLDQALAFERTEPPSLQGFLAWIEAEEIEVKRDPDAPLDAVRLMTVHGAKGLQAPVVILADTTHQPNLKRKDPLLLDADGRMIPFEPGATKGLTGRVKDALDAREKDQINEHWRLLYVALTRAETLLCIGGVKMKERKPGPNTPPDRSWYKAVSDAMLGLGAEPMADPWLGCDVIRHASGTPALPAAVDLDPASGRLPLPDWVRAPAPAEPRPGRPLSPSALIADTLSEPPASDAAAMAARRGAVLHLLFERLPAVPPARRTALAEALVRQRLPDQPPGPIVAEVLRVLDDPGFADLFGPDSLAEAPLTARIGETLISGQVDRLHLTDACVRFVDFKTSRRVPASAEAAPPAHLAQMAGYAAALAQVFPGRRIEAALLYTAGPLLLPLPDALLARHAPAAIQPYPSGSLQPAAPITILPGD